MPCNMFMAKGRATQVRPADVVTIDISSTWGDLGNFAKGLASGRHEDALLALWPDIARAFAAAQAMTSIIKTLSEEQRSTVSATLCAELTKQGY